MTYQDILFQITLHSCATVVTVQERNGYQDRVYIDIYQNECFQDVLDCCLVNEPNSWYVVERGDDKFYHVKLHLPLQKPIDFVISKKPGISPMGNITIREGVRVYINKPSA